MWCQFIFGTNRNFVKSIKKIQILFGWKEVLMYIKIGLCNVSLFLVLMKGWLKSVKSNNNPNLKYVMLNQI